MLDLAANSFHLVLRAALLTLLHYWTNRSHLMKLPPNQHTLYTSISYHSAYSHTYLEVYRFEPAQAVFSSAGLKPVQTCPRQALSATPSSIRRWWSWHWSISTGRRSPTGTLGRTVPTNVPVVVGWRWNTFRYVFPDR